MLHSLDDGASWTEAGATALPAATGVVEVPPAAAAATLVDERSAAVVRLAAHMALEDADDRALDAGANLALLGEELVQFGRATPLGGGRWQLERLWRGRRGTEAAIGAAEVGASFVLLDRSAVRAIDLPAAAIGRRVRVLASGVGDAEGPVEAACAVDGRSVLPPSPVHLRVAPHADGSALVGWTRRSRMGWDWLDGADAPLGEERESYEVRVESAAAVRLLETGAPEALVTAAERAAGPVAVTVRQRGDRGLGAAALIVAPGI